ncbi:MAG: hypothetical protein CMI16_07425 [Opitutaceae bacterium]|nr:hypothetical protein [Opitutaceae bacterium]|tara:strand:- start:1775 stop:2074 length:300 start_codon:yes stop_codon:yes gene_type:complete
MVSFEWDRPTVLADIFSVVALAACVLSCCCVLVCKLRRASRTACIVVEVVLFVCGGSVWTLRQSIINGVASAAAVAGAGNVTSVVESVSGVGDDVLASW